MSEEDTLIMPPTLKRPPDAFLLFVAALVAVNMVWATVIVVLILDT